MSLGKEELKEDRYFYSNLGNRFTIITSNNKYKVFRKDYDGALVRISNMLYNTLDEAKKCLVEWININMKVDFPNLTL